MREVVFMKLLPPVLAIVLLAAAAPAQAQGPGAPISMPPHWAAHIVFQSLDCKPPRRNFGRIVDFIATSPDGGQDPAPHAPVDKRLQPCLPSTDDTQAYHTLQLQKFSDARALLLQYGVPFEPNDLLEADWSPALVAALASMPEMHRERRARHLRGVILADTLYLTPQFTIERTTVVVANHIVMEGKRQHLFDNRRKYYIFSATPAVAIGESLKQALREGGLPPHAAQPPPFSVIAGLGLPLNNWRLRIDTSDTSAIMFPVFIP